MNPTPESAPYNVSLGARCSAIARALRSMVLEAVTQPGPAYYLGFWPGWVPRTDHELANHHEMEAEETEIHARAA